MIGQDVLALAVKAREGKLQPHEFQVSVGRLLNSSEPLMG